MLKADLHLHAGEDKEDHIPYSSKELIDAASDNGYDVLSLTFHNKVHYPKSLVTYAESKGILLIPGTEAKIQGRHVLIYNKDVSKLKEVLRKARKADRIDHLAEIKEDCLIIAPHPYYIFQSLMDELEKNIAVFDGIEYSYFAWRWMNFNKNAVEMAKRHNKAIIGTSDLHRLYHFGYTWSMIKAEKNIDSIFKAIRYGKVKVERQDLPLKIFLWLGVLNLLRRT